MLGHTPQPRHLHQGSGNCHWWDANLRELACQVSNCTSRPAPSSTFCRAPAAPAAYNVAASESSTAAAVRTRHATFLARAAAGATRDMRSAASAESAVPTAAGNSSPSAGFARRAVIATAQRGCIRCAHAACASSPPSPSPPPPSPPRPKPSPSPPGAAACRWRCSFGQPNALGAPAGMALLTHPLLLGPL